MRPLPLSLPCVSLLARSLTRLPMLLRFHKHQLNISQDRPYLTKQTIRLQRLRNIKLQLVSTCDINGTFLHLVANSHRMSWAS